MSGGWFRSSRDAGPAQGAQAEPLAELREIIERDFSVEDQWTEGGRPTFLVRPRLSVREGFSRVRAGLVELGRIPLLRLRDGKLILSVLRRPQVKPERPMINLLLLLATVGTTMFVGYQMSSDLVNLGLMQDPLHGAILFSAGIMGVLGCHELGHWLMARARGVEASLPYFIPVPFFIGTFGAVIRQRTFPTNRDDLFDVAAAGPLLGFLALVPVAIIGIGLSHPMPIEAVPEGVVVLPPPLLFGLLVEWIAPIPKGYVMLFHPLAFAGWVGMVVTMLNLMPAGMLDGGHVARVVFGRRLHSAISFGAAIVTFLLGFWLMAMLMLFLALHPHPGPLEDVSPLSAGRKLVAGALAAIFILSLTSFRMLF